MEWQPIETAPRDGTEFQAWIRCSPPTSRVDRARHHAGGIMNTGREVISFGGPISFVGLSADHPTHLCNTITFGGAQANDVQSECPASTSDGNQKHQMSVTHIARWAFTAGQPPERSEASKQSTRGWPLGKMPEVTSAVRNDVKGTSWEPTWRRCAGKGLSMRTLGCPHSQGLHVAEPVSVIP